MITQIRQQLQSKEFRNIFLWFFVLALVLPYVVPQMFRKLSGQWVATVNSKEIPFKEWALRATIQQDFITAVKSKFGQYADLFLGSVTDPRQRALDGAIRDEIIYQLSEENNVYVTDDFIIQKMSDLRFIQHELMEVVPMAVLDQYGINQRALAAYLRMNNINSKLFDSMLKQKIEGSQVLKMTSAATYIPEWELKNAYKSAHLGHSYSMIVFNFDKMLKDIKKEPVTQEELTAFFNEENATKKRYFIPEKRSGTIWTFNPANYDVAISDETVQRYYEDNKKKSYLESPIQVEVAHIVLPASKNGNAQEAMADAQKLREELVLNPDSFASKARELSTDSKTAKNGGLIGFVTRGEQEEAFDRAAFLLKQDGDISSVISTKNGLEILKRISKKDAVYKPLASVKKEIVDTLSKKRFASRFMSDLKKVTSGESIDEKELAVILKKGTKKSIDFTPKTNDRTIQELFKAKVNQYGFYTEGETGYVVLPVTVQAGYLPTLDEIKDVVRDDVYEKRANQKITELLASSKKDAATLSLEEIAKKYGAHVEKSGMVKKDDTKALEALGKKGFVTSAMMQLNAPGSVTTSQEDDGNGVLIRLDEIESFNDADYQTKRSELSKELYKKDETMVTESLFASLRKSAKIEINPDILRMRQ